MSVLPRSGVSVTGMWLAILGGTIILLFSRDHVAWAFEFPEKLQLPITHVFNQIMDTLVETTGWFFQALAGVLDYPMKQMRIFLNAVPWMVFLLCVSLLAHAVGGARLTILSAATILYILVNGYWPEAMNSLALVAISVPLSIVLGFCIGTLVFLFPRTRGVTMVILDSLQTIPAFAYLIPIVLLFGFGPVVGLIASVLYAFPPMVRNSALGLSSVSDDVIESGYMSGATAWQLFALVRVPSAMKQILLGVNQATMAAFSMIIIASIIGGSADIGWEVLSTMRKAQFGESLLAGLVITLMAIVMDRITAEFARPKPSPDRMGKNVFARHPHLISAIIGSVVIILAIRIFPSLADFPTALQFYPAEALNDAISYIVVTFASLIALMKKAAFFFMMLPLKIGLETTISPYSWGFEFTFGLKSAYVVSASLLSLAALYRLGWTTALVTAFAFLLVYTGLTRVPWVSVLAIVTYGAWLAGGLRLLGTVGPGMLFILLAGVWPQAMLSVYLCGLAVFLSFVLGSTLGILASEYDVISKILKPVNDTLQTMPLFVILIPFVMIFKIGEFTALLAIMAYAIVPAVRYAEHGLRNVSKESVEAAISMGSTRWQLLWSVKLPLALPVLMLGLNQTIMYGIAMLVIAALVGTSGLGQQVYIGLGDGDFGVGMVAGLAMAIIAITADRFLQVWNGNRSQVLNQN